MVAAGLTLAALTGIVSAFGSYTNHAGLVLSGIPVKVEAKFVTLSNAQEVVSVPFSIFPERERRRLAAEGGSTQFVPPGILHALEGIEKQRRRSAARAAKGFVTSDEAAAFTTKANGVLDNYLDRAEREGRLLRSERRLLAMPDER